MQNIHWLLKMGFADLHNQVFFFLLWFWNKGSQISDYHESCNVQLITRYVGKTVKQPYEEISRTEVDHLREAAEDHSKRSFPVTESMSAFLPAQVIARKILKSWKTLVALTNRGKYIVLTNSNTIQLANSNIDAEIKNIKFWTSDWESNLVLLQELFWIQPAPIQGRNQWGQKLNNTINVW